MGDVVISTPPIPKQASQKFIPVFTWYYGAELTSAQEALLAKFSFSDLNRRSYKDKLGRDSWQVLKSFNSLHEVYLYQFSFGAYDSQDNKLAVKINTISRWNDARGHSMGNLNIDHTELFLLDNKGERIHDKYGVWLMDIGHQAYIDYWVEATLTDIVNKPCKADGIFVDGPSLIHSYTLTAYPAKYPTNSAWASAAKTFVLQVTSALHKKGVKVWFNMGQTHTSIGQACWILLDQSSDYPDILMDEGAFVTSYSRAFAGFHSESACRTSIDTMQSVKNVRVAMSSHVKGLPGDIGLDNFGKPVTYWDAFYFGLSCFLLGKNTVADNSCFSWHDSNKELRWFDEFDIDLGKAVGTYQVAQYESVNIYWREYEKGYVYANLSNTNVSGILLPAPCRQITHQNISNPFVDPIVDMLILPAHRGAILIKESVSDF